MTNLTINIVGPSCQISALYTPQLAVAVKKLPGRKWDRARRCWLIPDYAEKQACELIRSSFGLPKEMPGVVQQGGVLHRCAEVLTRESEGPSDWEKGSNFLSADAVPEEMECLRSKVLTFGKYRGQDLASVPLAYLKWLVQHAQTMKEENRKFALFAKTILSHIGIIREK